jgi:signal transduction histidine kinase
MRSFEIVIVAISISSVWAAKSATAAPIPLDDAVTRYDLVEKMEVLEDPSGKLTIADVASYPLSLQFDALRGHSPNIGNSHSVYFLRVTLCNPSRAPMRWYLEPYRRLNRVTVFRQRGGGFDRVDGGRMQSIFEREVLAPALLFAAPLAPGEQATFWLRVESTNRLRLDLGLVNDRALSGRLALEWALFGLFYGAMLALLLYNLFMFLSVGDRSYLYYSVLQFAMLAQHAINDDLAHSLFWPHSPRWRLWSESFFFGLFGLGALGFPRSFLELRTLLPRADRILAGLQVYSVAYGLLFFLSSSVWYQRGGLVLIAGCAVSLEIIGLYAWRRGSPNAPFYAIGWSMLCVLAAVAALYPPVWGVSTWVKLGGVVEALVLSLGLASRIHRMRREKEQIQAELIASQTAQAAVLERQVAERTRELEAALEKVKSAQSRMVQQARLASLGHLVAGVAHEVGNPLNFTRGGALEVDKKLEVISGALDGEPDLARARAALSSARRAAQLVTTGNERIERIVDHLRDYVSARPGPLEPTDLVASIEQTLAMMAQRLDSQSVRVVRDLEPLPKVACRSGQLGQVLMNLILNSCQAMPDGGELRIESRVRGDRAEIRVSDTGPGVPAAVAEAIFDPFFTTRPPSEGTGLGLSISYEIVRRHGGELELLESVKGATFLISLPIQAN